MRPQSSLIEPLSGVLVLVQKLGCNEVIGSGSLVCQMVLENYFFDEIYAIMHLAFKGEKFLCKTLNQSSHFIERVGLG